MMGIEYSDPGLWQGHKHRGQGCDRCSRPLQRQGHHRQRGGWPLSPAQVCKKVGVTDFCMDGALSFAGAALVTEIDAAAPFYGIPSPRVARRHFNQDSCRDSFSRKK
ncbi:hypothetical protein RRG08_037882 [Elysia crispata]|uniref:Dienelactone hydrolase domain-containing protein n=1 Tax=Elysia crispata TaxID=231223 RepID=A0AAE0ZJV8_9GAST|nr:hypothetical protein RRG08_037882 [Elysia crispata]